MFDVAVLLGVIAVLIAIFYFLSWNSYRKVPPGPRYFPLYKGGMLNAAGLKTLKDKYGDICSVRLPGQLFIVISSYEASRNLLVNYGSYFAGAPQNAYRDEIIKGYGVLYNDGKLWLEHRKFLLNTFRNRGVGKHDTEALIQKEAAAMCEEMGKEKGPFDPNMHVLNAIGTLIASVMFGQELALEIYRKLEDYLECVNHVGSTMSQDMFGNFWSVIKLLPGDPLSAKAHVKSVAEVNAYIQQKISEHERSFENGNVRDIIDVYLAAKKDAEQRGEEHTFTHPQLSRIVFDLYEAGVDTQKQTIMWTIYMLVKYPHIQKKAREEIEAVIGAKPLQTADRAKLPYTMAVIKEVVRYVGVVPGTTRRTLEDVEIDGFLYPKDSIILANFYQAHQDPKLFPNPNEYDPNNFYDESRNELRNTEYLLEFGAGKRLCIGEQLAEQGVFLVLATMLQHFSLTAHGELPSYVCDILSFPIRVAPTFKVICHRERD